MSKTIPVQITLPQNTHAKILSLAKDVDCISTTGKPKAASTVTKALRFILQFYSDEPFQKCLVEEGMDPFAYIQRCVRKGMKESLGEKK